MCGCRLHCTSLMNSKCLLTVIVLKRLLILGFLFFVFVVIILIQISEGRHLEHSLVSVDGHKDGGSLDGTRVGIIAKPSAEFVASVLGTWLSGGVAVPLALSYPEAELLHVMNDSVSPLMCSSTYQKCGFVCRNYILCCHNVQHTSIRFPV